MCNICTYSAQEEDCTGMKECKAYHTAMVHEAENSCGSQSIEFDIYVGQRVH
jgi:hypothetical protein